MSAESFPIRAQEAHKTITESLGMYLCFLKREEETLIIENGTTSLKIQLIIEKKVKPVSYIYGFVAK
jgi:hypothetical protein